MEFLKWRAEDGVAIVTINRPPANALAQQLIRELDKLMTEVEHNNDVRVVLLHGEGRRSEERR